MSQGPSNVVGFRPGGALPTFHNAQPQLIDPLREIGHRHLEPLVAALFDGMDDAFFEYSERAGSSSDQFRYLDAMREIRRERPACVQRFYDDFNLRITDFQNGTIKPVAREDSGSTTELSLLEADDLDRQVAVKTMIGRWTTRYGQALFALNRRLAVASRREALDDELNPFAIAHIINAFRIGLEPLSLAIDLHLIVLKQFERGILSRLEGFYQELNEQLARAGILPELRYVLPKRDDRRAPGARGAPGEAGAPGTEGGAAAGDAPYAGGSSSGSGGGGGSGGGSGGSGGSSMAGGGDIDGTLVQLVGELNKLLSAHRTISAPIHSGPAAPPVAMQDLMHAVSLLQSEAQGQIDAGEFRPSPANELKSALLNQISRLGLTQTPHTALGSDENAIDLVGMMFEYALQDRNLPAPMQAMLGRLQVPYLKVALLDRQFAVRKNHPARRLLDLLAQSCVGWTEESDKDRKLHDKVHEVVVTLMRDFREDISLFDRLIDDFEDFNTKYRRRSDIAERRASEAARGKEKLDAAQRSTAQEVLARLRERAVMPIVEDIVRRHWSAYMVLAQLRYGEDSPEWLRSVQVLDYLTLHGSETARRTADWIQSIEDDLHRGLAAIGLQANHVSELIGALVDVGVPSMPSRGAHPGAIDAGDGDQPLHPPRPNLGAALLPASGAATIDLDRFAAEAESAGIPQSADEDPMERSLRETWLETVRSLKPGTWLEFVRGDGARDRAKLLWVSATRLRYLFVNRAGVKIAEKDAQALAADFAEERASVLEETPLVDRALHAILDRLRSPADQRDKDAGTT